MISIAIDGPAGAGKSTIAKTVSRELGYIYVDTGALYRTVSLKFSREGATPEKIENVEEILSSLSVNIEFKNGEQRMLLDGVDVTDSIRTPEVSMMASAVSAIPAVRAFLLETQRRLARENNVIMDGRDIGTVVLPDAQIKIFLTASPEARADRRYKELIEKGMDVKFEDVLSDIIKRDHNDSTRAVAPLKPAEDSIYVDTSGNTLEQSVAELKGIIERELENVAVL